MTQYLVISCSAKHSFSAQNSQKVVKFSGWKLILAALTENRCWKISFKPVACFLATHPIISRASSQNIMCNGLEAYFSMNSPQLRCRCPKNFKEFKNQTKRFALLTDMALYTFCSNTNSIHYFHVCLDVCIDRFSRTHRVTNFVRRVLYTQTTIRKTLVLLPSNAKATVVTL